jgi:uncharacterized protein YlxW (UPF0749 family)
VQRIGMNVLIKGGKGVLKSGTQEDSTINVLIKGDFSDLTQSLNCSSVKYTFCGSNSSSVDLPTDKPRVNVAAK